MQASRSCSTGSDRANARSVSVFVTNFDILLTMDFFYIHFDLKNKQTKKNPGQVLSGLEHHPIHRKAVDSIPCQGTCGRWPINVSPSPLSISISISLPLFIGSMSTSYVRIQKIFKKHCIEILLFLTTEVFGNPLNLCPV